MAGESTAWGGFLASKWAAVLAGVLALLAVAAGIVAFKRNSADAVAAPIERGTPAPSAYSLELAATSSPFVSRGGTVSLELTAAPGVDVAAVELWADGDPYVVIDDPALFTQNTAGQTAVNIDYVPMLAGAHVITARALDADGKLAQAIPVAIPALDLPSDRGIAASGVSEVAFAPPEMRFVSAPGDSLTTIANRLGVKVTTLSVLPLPDSATAMLSTGSIVTGAVPSLKGLGKPVFPKTSWAAPITAEVADCVVTVRNNAGHTLRIYGGAGMAALGDVDAGGQLVLTGLPIGPTVLQAMEPNITATNVTGANGPSAPIVATIPDECARSGWTGDAYVSGGLLLTDAAVPKPYLYVSTDKGTWQRVPAADDAYLATGAVSFADIRTYVDLGDYDQLDVEVWSGEQPVELAAQGHFCRKDMVNAGPGSSASGGECQPKDPSHLGATAPGATVSAAFDIKGTTKAGPPVVSQGVIVADNAPYAAYFAVAGTAPFAFTTTANAAGYSQVQYQVSLAPMSPASPSLNPPGLLWSKTVTSGQAVTVDPWLWHNATVDGDTLVAGDAVALDDEVTLAMARARVEAGLSLVDTLYVRAVAVTTANQTNGPISLGAATKSIEITMPSIAGAAWPVISSPSATITPGRDQSASFSSVGDGTLNVALNPGVRAVTDQCHEVVSYPPPHTWVMYPGSTPRWRTAKGIEYSGPRKSPKDVLVANSEGNDDLSFAKLAWPRQDVIYCMDYDWREKQTADANEEYGKSDCGLGCVLTFVIYGAAQGFILGGPYGALVGAIAGLTIGIGSAIDPNFYAAVQAAWDEIAGFYNAVFTKVWSLVSDINLFCYGIGQLGKDAQKFCDDTVYTVGSAVISYYTGIPPALATSAELQEAADGNMEAVIILALDAGLSALGIDINCSTFSLDDSEAKALKATAQKAGLTDAEINDALTSNGNGVSACSAIAGIITKRMRAAMDFRQGQLMQSVTGHYAVPGQVLSPVTDTQPVVVLTGVPAAGSKGAQTCPAVANAEVSQGGVTQKLQAVQGTLAIRYHRAITGKQGAPPEWVAQIPLASLVSVDEPKRNKVIETKPAAAGAPYLKVTVTSPCFAAPVAVSVDKYVFFGFPGAYVKDDRPAVAYH